MCRFTWADDWLLLETERRRDARNGEDVRCCLNCITIALLLLLLSYLLGIVNSSMMSISANNTIRDMCSRNWHLRISIVVFVFVLSVDSMLHVYDVWCVMYGMMYDVWCMMYDVWCMMYDVWCMMYDVWCMMYDVWCMMYDVWCCVCKETMLRVCDNTLHCSLRALCDITLSLSLWYVTHTHTVRIRVLECVCVCKWYYVNPWSRHVFMN